MPALRLISDPSVVDPVLDAAVSHALMLRVAAGDLPDTLRISRPGPSVAFGKRDVVSLDYPSAVTATRQAGSTPVERLAGGRASAFHEDTIHLSHTVHDPDPRERVTDRFQQTAELIANVFRSLGIDAHVGEIDGEYCPGAHSVNARHATKLMGIGQRVVQNAAHVGAVIVVDDADRIRTALTPVYIALGLTWRPDTTGSLADERPALTWDQTRDAVEAGYGERYDLRPAQLDDDTLALANTLTPEHEPSTTDADRAGGVGFDGSGGRRSPGPQNPSTGPARSSADS